MSKTSAIENKADIPLFERLTDMNDEVLPATDLIRHLVKEIGHDACEAKSNFQTAYKFVSRARDLHNEIHGRIKQSSKKTADWATYHQELERIDPLEDLLLRFVLISERATLDAPPITSVQKLTSSADTWTDLRQDLREALGDAVLGDGASEWNRDINVLQKYDDIVMFNAVLDSVVQSKTSTKFPKSKYLRNVNPTWKGPADVSSVVTVLNTMYSNLKNRPTMDEPTVTLSIRCVMVLDAVLKYANTCTGDQEKLGLYLMSKMIWDEAKSILSKLSAEIGTPKKINTLKDEWVAFEQKLKTLPDGYTPAVPDLDSLIEHLQHVRRPFHSRAVALVQQCHIVWELAKEKKSADSLEETIGAASKALISAKDMNDEFTDLTWANVEKHQATNEFNNAIAQIGESLKAYQATGKEPEIKQAMATATGRDSAVVGLLTERLTRRKGKYSARLGAAKVSVTITSSGKESKTYDVDPAESVDLILWRHFSGNTAGLSTIPQLYRKEAGKEDQRITSGTKVSSLGSGPITLILA